MWMILGSMLCVLGIIGGTCLVMVAVAWVANRVLLPKPGDVELLGNSIRGWMVTMQNWDSLTVARAAQNPSNPIAQRIAAQTLLRSIGADSRGE